MRRQVPFVFNPALLTREELRAVFVVRHAERDQILAHLRSAGSSPQHVILLGDRGMGKTTLLLRVAYSLDEDPDLAGKWLAVRFDEEQYNLGDLSDFWLNCLEKIGEDTGDPAPLREVDDLVQELKGEQLREAAFLRLRQYSVEHKRRLLLLVDNLDLLLARLAINELRRLRELLQHEPWLLLVGASASPVVETFDYESPFYDFFHVIYLGPLNYAETLVFLQRLGASVHRETQTMLLLESRRLDLEILHIMVGGNLRTITLLFSHLDQDPFAELSFLLDRLLDQYTSSYKDAIEALPAQGQRVFDALARYWDPATAEDVSRELRIERGAASAQLHRLVDRGLVVKVQLPRRSLAFQLRDRFFNLWYLMRGGRRQRNQLRALLSFLGLFHRLRQKENVLDRVIDRLTKLHLVSFEIVQEARTEALRLDGRELQEDLFPRGSTQVSLLALLLAGRSQAAEEGAEKYLRAQPGDDLVRALLAHLLEKRVGLEKALEVLAAPDGQAMPTWRRLELARLLLAQGEVDNAGSILKTLLGSHDIEASELADLAVALAQRGGDKLGWLAQGLLDQALESEPASSTILLAACQVELALDHMKQAFDRFREALNAAGNAESRLGPVLDTALQLAGDHPQEVLNVLKERGFTEEWPPVTHALAFLVGESDRLETLSPEMRAFAEMVVTSIREAGRPAAIGVTA